jgi:hypothetical protein
MHFGVHIEMPTLKTIYQQVVIVDALFAYAHVSTRGPGGPIIEIHHHHPRQQHAQVRDKRSGFRDLVGRCLLACRHR